MVVAACFPVALHLPGSSVSIPRPHLPVASVLLPGAPHLRNNGVEPWPSAGKPLGLSGCPWSLSAWVLTAIPGTERGLGLWEV